MSLDYNDLKGVVNDVKIWVVSVVGDHIREDVGVPGCEGVCWEG